MNRLARKALRRLRKIETEMREATEAVKWRADADAREANRQRFEVIKEEFRKAAVGAETAARKPTAGGRFTTIGHNLRS